MKYKRIVLIVILITGILIVVGRKPTKNHHEVHISQHTLSSGCTTNVFQVNGMKNKVLEDRVNEILIAVGRKSTGNHYVVYISQYTLSSGYTMNIFQVNDMKNKVLEDRVNESLNSYLHILVEPWFLPERLEEYEPIVHCQTERYLSVEYSFRYTTAINLLIWHYCITIDMQTGEAVFLDDLIDVNEAFAERIKNGAIIKKGEGMYTEEEAIEIINKWYSQRETDYIQRKFNIFTRDYLYGDYYRENGYVMSSYEPSIYQHTFYLEEDKIVFINQNSMEWIMTDDIEDLLKVPKW